MTSASYAQNQGDDTFQLYDLRVEVICPPGKRIMCGAKEGDYFTLQGEMLYLPPGQGISIYSLSEYPTHQPAYITNRHTLSTRRGPPAALGKAAPNSSERLDVDRRRDRVPGPVLPQPPTHRPHRPPHLPPR